MVISNVGISYLAKDADTILGNYFKNNSNQVLRAQSSLVSDNVLGHLAGWQTGGIGVEAGQQHASLWPFN